jgi:hypothetical protein
MSDIVLVICTQQTVTCSSKAGTNCVLSEINKNSGQEAFPGVRFHFS